jgi:hypothetical protein
MGAIGLNGVYLAAPGGPLNTGQFLGPILKDVLQQRYCLSDLSDAEITEVLRSYFIEFYDLAACIRADALTDPLVAAHNLPHR